MRGLTWFWIIITVSVLTVMSVFFIPTDEFPLAYIRNALGVLITFFLPGYALMKCLYKTKPPIKVQSKELESIERLAMSIGLSIALIAIIGSTLYYSPVGLSSESITIVTSTVTPCLGLIALRLQLLENKQASNETVISLTTK